MNKESILRELDVSIANEKNDIEYISKLNNSKDKVKYLRIVKKYTQEKAAEIIGISTRHLRRIENKIKKEMSC